MVGEMLGTMFGDRVVTPTELARHVKEITQGALRKPVTIHRPEGDLALLDREKVAALGAAASASETLVNLLTGFLRSNDGRWRPGFGWEWLEVFTRDDILEFIGEYAAAVKQALSKEAAWDLAETVLYEWRESARALTNRELLEGAANFRGAATGDEVSHLSIEELRERLDIAMSKRLDRKGG
ncbi:MAG: hypothetical protein Q7O66_15935 [Dehalococcoidia bacterium]|nr:hypothetical protein [Dehalococcoidia bacterium]